MTVRLLITGGTFDKEYNELTGGLFNLGSALAFAQCLPHGVYVAMNGRCFTWDNVRKNRESGVFEVCR